MPKFRLVPGRRLAIACLFAMASAFRSAPARAATTDDDPFRMLEERHEVTAASKRPQPLSETPSIVTVITANEIRAHGYRTLGEALQFTRGFYTRYDRNYTYVGARGVQRPGDYNNKVLLTIDGHTVNSPIYGEAPFGRELGLDMERVERIEVIRGPGSSLYGSNAVLAVINVVTCEARASVAAETGGSTGSRGERRAYLALASARGDLPQLTLTGSWTEVRGADYTIPGFGPSLSPSGKVARLDAERSSGLLGGLSWHATRLTVKLNERLKHIPTGAYGTRLGDPSTRTSDGHDYVELATITRPVRAVELSARGYWDGSRYWGSYAYGPDSVRLTNRDIGASDLVGGELRAHWRPTARHVATVGTEGRWTFRALQTNDDLETATRNTWSNLKTGLASVYAQDEMQLFAGTRLTAGARLDGDARRGSLVSPRLDLRVPLGTLTTWKLLAGTAYRAPVPYETGYAAAGQVPNPSLLPERVNSVETAIERRAGAANLVLSLYRSTIRDLIDVVILEPSGDATFFNRGHVASTGVEGGFEWSPRPGVNARADLAWQQSRDLVTRIGLTNSPPWNGHLVLTGAPAGSAMRLGFGMRWLGSRSTLRGGRVPSYSVLDARLAVLPRSALECGIEARNLLDARYADPAGSEHTQEALDQDPRGYYFTLSLRRSAAP